MKRTPEPPAEVDELRTEIAHIRAELGETLEELAARADVKARLHNRAEAAKAELRERAGDVVARAEDAGQQAVRLTRRYRVQLLAVAGAAGLLLMVVEWRRRRETRRWSW